MRIHTAIVLAGLLLAAPAFAGDIDTLTSSGPEATNISLPDSTHVPIVFGKDIKWTEGNGMRQAALFGIRRSPASTAC